MATALRLRFPAANFGQIASAPYNFAMPTNPNFLAGGAATWNNGSLEGTVGDGTIRTAAATTVAGPTAGIEVNSAGTAAWISAPLDADVTISGTIAVDLWGIESVMTVNATFGVLIQRLDSTGAIASTIAQGISGTELGTSVTNLTFNLTPTSTNMLKGDRIRVIVYADDATGLTMAAGSATLRCNGTSGADGDSKITFNETIGFITTDPTGSQIFPTNTASAVSTASVDREAWTSRGAGVQNDVTNTAAGPTSGIQVTDTAGGTVVDWFTKTLVGFTLAGAVLVNSRALESATAANAVVRCEIAIVDGDGTNPVVWASAEHKTELSAVAENAIQFYVAGDDTSVATGKRLRIRFYINDTSTGNMAASQTVTTYYAGTSGGASGDTYLTFTQTLTESGGVTTVDGNFTANAILRKTLSGSFTIDASIFRPGQGQLTADAIIRRSASGSFTADAAILRRPTGSVAADAILKKTITNAKGTLALTTTLANGFAIFSFHTNYTSLTTGTYDTQSANQTPLRIGQEFNGVNYVIYQSFISFDTGSIPDDATILSALLELDGITDNSAQDFVIEVFVFDYGAEPSTGADVRTAAQLGSLTKVAELNSSVFSTAQNVFSDVAFAANLVKTGDTRLVLASSRNRTQNAPAGGTLEYVTFASQFGAGTDPKLTIEYTQGTPFTIDAVIARYYPITLNAVLRKTASATFTIDAVLAGGATIQAGLTLDATIRRTTSATFTADAWLRRNQTATFTANAVIIRRPTVTFTADAVLRKVANAASFTLDAWIYAPRDDPTGPGEPGETPMVSILVDDVDVTRDVVLSDATFTMLVNGAIGTFRFKVRDDGHTYDFTSGAEVTVDIDGRRKFGGYALQPKRSFAFAVEDTTVPSRPSRFHVLEGVDYNILMTKRVVYDHTTPENVELRHWPEDSDDDDVIRYIFGLTDLAADGVTLSGVTHIGTPNPDKPGVVASGGLRFVDAMREINRAISGVFYIDPFKVFNYVDVDTPNATYGLSDVPDLGDDVGYRELEQVNNGTGLVNDALVWGAGMGSNRMVFSREEDAASIAAHGLWQFGEFTTSMFRQASVDMRAGTIVNGTPQSKRGGKDDQESWSLVSFEKSFTVGEKVEIDSAVFGKADVVPIRRMTMTFPTKKNVKYQLVLSHEIDEPWNIFEFWFPKWQMPDIDIDIPEGEGGGEPDTPCAVVAEPWTDLGDWQWVSGSGDGAAGREGLTPGWGAVGNTFYFVAAADAGQNDGVIMKLDAGPGTVDFFEYLQGGAFVITGSYTNPATTHISGNAADVSFTVAFDNGFAGGISFEHSLEVNNTFPERTDSISLGEGSNIVHAYGAASAGTHDFALYVYPWGAHLVTDGADLTFVRADFGLGLADLSLTDRLNFSLGEFPAAGSGMVAGGTWAFGPFNAYRLDGTTSPWCPTPAPPDGEGRDPLTGDGSITVFTLRSPYIIRSTRVFIDGYFQRPGIEYTESDPTTGEITFTTAPDLGSSITVFYHAFVGELN